LYILSLETSTKVFSLAVSQDDRILRYRNIRTARILESSIIPSIDKLLSSCHLSLEKIDAIAIGLGPGSFTSLRVGLSTVKALAMAAGKKIVGVGSLDVIAFGVSGQKADEICVLLDARRGKVYAAIYDPLLNRKTEYLLTTIEDVLDRVQGTTLFTGDAIALYKEQITTAYKEYAKEHTSVCKSLFAKEKFWFPQSKELAKLGFKKAQEDQWEDPARIVPIYLYPQDCQVHK
jgi:tRNA threonylcarbamoyladenosine biosynthesis protein TsaB